MEELKKHSLSLDDDYNLVFSEEYWLAGLKEGDKSLYTPTCAPL